MSRRRQPEFCLRDNTAECFKDFINVITYWKELKSLLYFAGDIRGNFRRAVKKGSLYLFLFTEFFPACLLNQLKCLLSRYSGPENLLPVSLHFLSFRSPFLDIGSASPASFNTPLMFQLLIGHADRSLGETGRMVQRRFGGKSVTRFKLALCYCFYNLFTKLFICRFTSVKNFNVHYYSPC